MATKRLFIGFPVLDADGRWLKAQVLNHNHTLTSSIRWTIDGNFHITSVFLGDIECALLPKIIESINLVSEGQLKTAVLISKIANFPHYKSKLLAAYITPSDCLDRFYCSLTAQLSSLIRLKHPDYQPHITLARGLLNEDELEIESINYKINLTHLVLYESIMQNTINKYQMLHKCELL